MTRDPVTRLLLDELGATTVSRSLGPAWTSRQSVRRPAGWLRPATGTELISTIRATSQADPVTPTVTLRSVAVKPCSNAQPSSLGSDLALLGLTLWPALERMDPRAPTWNASLVNAGLSGLSTRPGGSCSSRG